jgi:hypothetical protein
LSSSADDAYTRIERQEVENNLAIGPMRPVTFGRDQASQPDWTFDARPLWCEGNCVLQEQADGSSGLLFEAPTRVWKARQSPVDRQIAWLGESGLFIGVRAMDLPRRAVPVELRFGPDGELWIGTLGGLFRYDFAGRLIQHTKAAVPPGFCLDPRSGIFLVRDGRILRKTFPPGQRRRTIRSRGGSGRVRAFCAGFSP